MFDEIEQLLESSEFGGTNGDEDNPQHLLSALITKWVFILCGQPEAPSATGRGAAVKPQPNIPLPQDAEQLAPQAGDMLEALLLQTIRCTDELQQETLLTYWRKFNHGSLEVANFMLDAIGFYDGQLQKEIKWKRKLVSQLQRKFKALQKQPQTA